MACKRFFNQAVQCAGVGPLGNELLLRTTRQAIHRGD